MKKIALISGITGQDGSYLADFLLKKNYIVHGIVRRTSSINRERINKHFNVNKYIKNKNLNSFFLHYGDLLDSGSLINIISKIRPDEVYNLAAQSHVGTSFEIPEYTLQATGFGTLNLLQSLKNLKINSKFYQAGSSEMFGNSSKKTINEKTPFNPRSPYAAAKVYAHSICVNYREAYNMFISNGILFNHESPRRGENFVTRKITLGAAAIKLGLQNKLVLGNLSSKRDWGYAKDYVEAMWLMLQQKNPDDFIISTNKSYSVEFFCKIVFDLVDLDYKKYVVSDKKYFRPTEVDYLKGNYSKAKKSFNWSPKTSIQELAKIMIDHDMEYLLKRK
jgi:GDPmannose 4,6-dehydratase